MQSALQIQNYMARKNTGIQLCGKCTHTTNIFQ